MVQKTPRPPSRQSAPYPRNRRNPPMPQIFGFVVFGYIRRPNAHSVFSWESGGIGKSLYSKAGYSRQAFGAFWKPNRRPASPMPQNVSSQTLRKRMRPNAITENSIKVLFCVAPVIAHADLDQQRCLELRDAFHFALHQPRNRVYFLRRAFEDQFIMHLQQHRRLVGGFLQRGIDAYHCQLDQIRRRPLERRIDRRALREPARIGVAAIDVGNRPLAPEQG